MTSIELNNVSVAFPVYSAGNHSFFFAHSRDRV
jgi:hypothetical protein